MAPGAGGVKGEGSDLAAWIYAGLVHPGGPSLTDFKIPAIYKAGQK